jgi:tetratricopeptide (TPR) repeat protein
VAGDQARELRARGIAAAKAGSKEEARQLLQQSVRLEPKNEAAWLWLASVARDAGERKFCLEQVISINPNNPTALQALQAMSGTAGAAPPPADSSTGLAQSLRRLTAPRTAPAEADPSPTPSSLRIKKPSDTASPAPPRMTEQEIMAQKPGIPMPSQERIAEAHKQIDRLMIELTEPLPQYNWTRKRSGRAGEGDIILYRAYVTAGIVAVLILLGAAGVIALNNSPQLQLVVYGASATPTVTPSVTPTNTPGLTPTPSMTPQRSPTPSPTVPFEITPGDPIAPPRATAVYPQINAREIAEAFAAIQRGNARAAIPTLSAERQRQVSFDPAPFYYEALAYLALNDTESALETLEDAQSRLNERNTSEAKPLLDSGFAQVYWRIYENASARGGAAAARDALALVQNYAQNAVQGDPRLEEPYILLAKAAAQERRFDDAIAALDQGLSVPALRQNVRLIMTKADVYYRQREFGLADYQAFLARYIDPTTEAAYQLQYQIAMDQNRPGQAVLIAQDYLHFYPGSTTAYQLLGDAHFREGSYDLALQAYTQGLAGNTNDQASANMLVGRGRIYMLRGRYDLAREDFTRALAIDNSPSVLALRMEAAYRDGRYQIALDDAERLRGTDVISEARLDLLRGRALIESADDSQDYARAITVLTGLDRASLNAEERALVDEYIARGQLAARNFSAAQTAVEAALAVRETPYRRYLRGQILEARGERASARRDYEWVVTLSQVIPLDFAADARSRLAALR